MTRAIPKGITRPHVLKALDDLGGSTAHEFGEPTKFELVHNGKTYPPKAVIGRAALYAFGAELGPYDFSGGKGVGQANRVLQDLGFNVRKIEGKPPVVSFDQLAIGESYERPHLADVWGYEDWHAIGRGIVTPAGDDKIVLFVTKNKQKTMTQYQDHFDGDTLHLEGETNRVADNRLISSPGSGDEVHLFYREWHHSPFTYYGEIHLASHKVRGGKPTHFTFVTGRSEIIAAASLATEQASLAEGDAFEGDPEGRERMVAHIRYERSLKNREEAIRIHGTICMACGFDFNKRYGEELAKNFIEIHHNESITKQANMLVNPKTDLSPLCSNCHRMVHKKRREVMLVEQLRQIIERQQRHSGAGAVQ
jgi:5-methylcytosine-specific restriction enzyme A